jgi:uncharacterized protein (TIGR03083 family)
MVTTKDVSEMAPRAAALDRPTAMRLAETEYGRYLAVLRGLEPAGWQAQTDCTQWDVRALATHVLGMAEMSASMLENRRQTRIARRRGAVFIDALTSLQVSERAALRPEQIIARMERVAPKAARGRRRAPAFIRRRVFAEAQDIGGRLEQWTLGYLIDVIMTRDPWMHRVDTTRAVGRPMELTAGHDGVLVADAASEWASRHGQPCTLRLTGPAGGTWAWGSGGPATELDAIEFCRTISGRAPGDGLLSQQVPF